MASSRQTPFFTVIRPSRVINSEISRHMGGGLEIMEGVNVHWTVTYDEILYIHEGHMTIRTDRMKAAAGSGYSTATDLADWLVREAGLPFRDAHHVTGRAVALAEQKGCELSALSLDELQAINPAITDKVYDVLTVEASVASRTSFGGTAPDNVRQQIAWWRGRN